MDRSDFTFVITSYRSHKIIVECIKDIPKDVKIILVDNSGDKNLKIEIEKKYNNVDYYLMDQNIM